MLAVAASLVVRKDLHPALQYLLLEAAAEIHSGPDVFHRPGRFPAAEAIDLPLSKQAEAFYRSGRPFIYSYLPFWLAGPVERLLIVLTAVRRRVPGGALSSHHPREYDGAQDLPVLR
jgi:hypothetical protein